MPFASLRAEARCANAARAGSSRKSLTAARTMPSAVKFRRHRDAGIDAARDALRLVICDGHRDAGATAGNRLQQRGTAVRDDEPRAAHQVRKIRLRQRIEAAQPRTRRSGRTHVHDRFAFGERIGGRQKLPRRILGARVSGAAARHDEHESARLQCRARQYRLMLDRAYGPK